MRRIVLTVALLAIAAAGRARAAEFTDKPKVEKKGEGYAVTFAVKEKCDATVAIVDRDGRVVKHIASGMRDPGVQAIEWDGKDDAGKPVPAGCSARVSLGLKPGFERIFTLGSAPGVMNVTGMVVGPDGTLYVIDKRVAPGTSFGSVIFAFDRDGNFLRVVKPSLSDRIDSSKRRRPIDISRKRQTPVVTKDGRILVGANYGGGYGPTLPMETVIFMADGSAPGERWGPNILWKIPGISTRRGGGTSICHMALSPDEKHIYVSGTFLNGGGRKDPATHSVFRLGWADRDKEHPEPFLGEWTVAGKDNEHFDNPHGIATDRSGNVYVADWGNDRIQVFKPDGIYLRSLPVPCPDWIAVSAKTGEVYVLCVHREPGMLEKGGPIMGRYQKARARKQEIVKLSPGDGKVLAKLELPKGILVKDYNDGVMVWLTPIAALDAGAGKPIVWVMYPGEGEEYMWKVEDRGDSLVKVKAFSEERVAHATQRGGTAIATDAGREEVYVKFHTTRTVKAGKGHSYRLGKWWRFDGRTGDCAELPIKNVGGNLTVGVDGLLYIDGFPTKKGHVLRRFTRDGKEMPFSAVPEGIPLPRVGDRHLWGALRGAFAVNREGEIYMALVKKVITFCSIEVYGPDGTHKRDVVKGLNDACCSLHLDAAGNIYITDLLTPASRGAVPEHLKGNAEAAKKIPKAYVRYGTTFKFPPSGGEFANDDRGEWVGRKRKRRGVKGAEWGYYGFSVISGRSGAMQCICRHSAGGLDRFGRSYIPDLLNCTVVVVDGGGNLVRTFGRYGPLMRKQTVGEDPYFWKPEYIAATDTAAYVCDTLSGHAVRVRLGYEAEETAAVP